jgi:protein SCO1
MRLGCLIAGIALSLISCFNGSELPYLGQDKTDASGKLSHYSVGKFNFLNQDMQPISELDLKGKVYVADFFFVSCPTICPVMKKEMLRVYAAHGNKAKFAILSHTIDPMRDSLSVLKAYKERLAPSATNWHFLRAEKSYTFAVAQKQYFVSATDSETPDIDGGVVHSGAFILVDQAGHIRGMYDGTRTEEVDKLIKDIGKLF